MNKELLLLIRMCATGQDCFTADELAALLNLKYRENVYLYLRKLHNEGYLTKEGRAYCLNNHEKVRIITSLQHIYNRYVEDLLSIHTKRVLERFAKKPILHARELPYHNLRHVKELVKKTRILFSKREHGTHVYILRTWELPVQKILAFFNIKLSFDAAAYAHEMLKNISAFTGEQQHLRTSEDVELERMNLQNYLEKHDFILDKLKNTDHPELAVIDILTQQKLKKLDNPFAFAQHLNDWKIKYVYNTDKIEGNALTYEEVRTALTEGIEGVKRAKKDLLETTNSKTALENIFDLRNELTLEFIKKLHKIVQAGISPDAGRFKQRDNCIISDNGTLIDTTTPAQFVAERMKELMTWYSKAQHHPLVLASIVHNQFVYIHPFLDGNGRVARLLFNFILMKHSYFPIIFYNDEKYRYYDALRQAKDGDIKPFLMSVAEQYRIQLENF